MFNYYLFRNYIVTCPFLKVLRCFNFPRSFPLNFNFIICFLNRNFDFSISCLWVCMYLNLLKFISFSLWLSFRPLVKKHIWLLFIASIVDLHPPPPCYFFFHCWVFILIHLWPKKNLYWEYKGRRCKVLYPLDLAGRNSWRRVDFEKPESTVQEESLFTLFLELNSVT